MKTVTTFKEELVKPGDLVPHRRYKVISATSMDTRFGASILIQLRDEGSKLEEDIMGMFLPKR